MTKVNIKKIKRVRNLECGDYFEHDGGDVYIMTRISGRYVLVNTDMGGIWDDPATTILGAFGGSRRDFRWIQELTITH